MSEWEFKFNDQSFLMRSKVLLKWFVDYAFRVFHIFQNLISTKEIFTCENTVVMFKSSVTEIELVVFSTPVVTNFATKNTFIHHYVLNKGKTYTVFKKIRTCLTVMKNFLPVEFSSKMSSELTKIYSVRVILSIFDSVTRPYPILLKLSKFWVRYPEENNEKKTIFSVVSQTGNLKFQRLPKFRKFQRGGIKLTTLQTLKFNPWAPFCPFLALSSVLLSVLFQTLAKYRKCSRKITTLKFYRSLFEYLDFWATKLCQFMPIISNLCL